MSEDTLNGHSLYGPSASQAWLSCPGSVAVTKAAVASGQLPPEDSSDDSKEGDEAHDLAAKLLLGEIDATEVPDEMRPHVVAYASHCQDDEIDFDTLRGVEQSVPLFYRPEDSGTVDHFAYSGAGLAITDLKYGQGVKVYAEENTQLAIYALSLIGQLEKEGAKLPDDLPCSLSIFQPRYRDFDGVADTWILTLGELKAFGEEIEAGYVEAHNTATLAEFGEGISAYVVPGDKQCQFCPARGVCAVRTEMAFAGLPDEANPLKSDAETVAETCKAIKSGNLLLEPAQIVEIHKNAKGIKGAVEKVLKNEYARLQQGGELRGLKLVPGPLGARRWVDKEKAQKALQSKLGAKDSYKPREVITAPQAITALKENWGEYSTRFKNSFEANIVRPDGAPKLVLESDEGDALFQASAEDDFEIETGEVEIDDESAAML